MIHAMPSYHTYMTACKYMCMMHYGWGKGHVIHELTPLYRGEKAIYITGV